MSVVLFMEPKTPPITWKRFCRVAPPFAVAVDGYVADAPKFCPRRAKRQKNPQAEPEFFGPMANFNHHEKVSRLETRATCAQILLAIRQGFFETFRNGEGPIVNAFANDCDQDVCTSIFLLENPVLVTNTVNPLINRLVYVEDMMDSTAGAYPFPKDLITLQHFAWVFEPYTQFRLSGGLDQRNAKQFETVVWDVVHRIQDHVLGRGKTLPLDTQYNVLDHGTGWSMVEEIGAQARTGMFADGIKAFLSVRPRSDGRFNYIIGRMSQFIPVDIPQIMIALNKAEQATNEDRWGCGTTIGGSSRITGSKLKPSEVKEVMEKDIARQKISDKGQRY